MKKFLGYSILVSIFLALFVYIVVTESLFAAILVFTGTAVFVGIIVLAAWLITH